LPLEVVPWEKYDGSYACFQPDDMNLRELQEMPTELMKKFYDSMSFFRIALRTVVFPCMPFKIKLKINKRYIVD
jgi:hypothetical protein